MVAPPVCIDYSGESLVRGRIVVVQRLDAHFVDGRPNCQQPLIERRAVDVASLLIEDID